MRFEPLQGDQGQARWLAAILRLIRRVQDSLYLSLIFSASESFKASRSELISTIFLQSELLWGSVVLSPAMDFMKVLDQTLREIKWEVNLKVLMVPEIEQKIVMNVLWKRVGDTSANWHHIYKDLAVIEYLIANGSERAVDDIMEHNHQIMIQPKTHTRIISGFYVRCILGFNLYCLCVLYFLKSLSGFEYVKPNGKDLDINVRKKAETILALIEDKEKIEAVRNKSSATCDKYFGLSLIGITYKSSSSSYGTISGSREGDSFRDSYKDSGQSHLSNDGHHKSHESFSKENEGSRLKKGALYSARCS